MLPVSVNFLAVIVAAIVSMVLGFLWYGPLFGKQWMKLMGFTKESREKAKKAMGKTYGVSMVGALVMAYVLSYFLSYALADTAMEGAIVGFWAWFGFVAPVMLTSVLYGSKSLSLYYIDVGYQLVSLIAMGAIVAAWV